MNVQAMTVADLIEHLKTQPQDLPVCYRTYSEYALLEVLDMEVLELCHPRPDGWIHSKRPDKGSQLYLVLPGN